VSKIGKVLILLPVFDEENNLERLLNSIIEQKHKDWILAFQDNASKDKSIKILTDFSKIDHRIVGKSLERTVSGAENWKSLAKWALSDFETDYVCWVSGDDKWSHASYLNNLIEEAERTKNVAIIAPIFQTTDTVGNLVGGPIELKAEGPLRVRKLLKNWHYVNLILGLYPREIFEKIFNSPSAQFTDTKYLDWWWTYTALKFSDIRLSKNSIYLKALQMTDNQQLLAPRSSVKQKIYIILLQPFKLVKNLFVEQRFRFNIFTDRIFFLIISYYFLLNLIKSISELICNVFLKLKIKF
jgi:glycosyltransferase involved in cell wall biosynthesis